jgi:hypothetical protein
MGHKCYGSMPVSKTVGRGSTPWWPASYVAMVKVDIIRVYEILVPGSSPGSGANLCHLRSMNRNERFERSDGGLIPLGGSITEAVWLLPAYTD